MLYGNFINQAYISILKKLFKPNFSLNITQLTYGYIRNNWTSYNCDALNKRKEKIYYITNTKMSEIYSDIVLTISAKC